MSRQQARAQTRGQERRRGAALLPRSTRGWWVLALVGVLPLLAGFLLLSVPPVAAWLLAAGIVTLALYAWDKARAQSSAGRRGKRVPERVLLGIGVLGGAPAALVAMHLLRHKTRHPRFWVTNWIATAVWVALLLGSLSVRPLPSPG